MAESLIELSSAGVSIWDGGWAQRFDVIGRVFSRDVFAIVVVNLIGINGLEG